MGEELETYILKKLDDAIEESKKSSEFHFAAKFWLPKLHKDFTELKELIEKKRTKIKLAAATAAAAASRKESIAGPSSGPARPHPKPAAKDPAASVAKIPDVSKPSAPAVKGGPVTGHDSSITAKEESKVLLPAAGVKMSEAPPDAGDEKKIGAPTDAGDKKDTGAPLDAGDDKKDTGAPLDGGGDKKDSGAPLDAGENEKDTGARMDAGGDEKGRGAPLDAGVGKKDTGALMDAGDKKDSGAPLDDKKESDAPLDAGDEKESGAPLNDKKESDAPLDAGDKKESDAPLDGGDKKESASDGVDKKDTGAPSDAGDKKETDTPLDAGDKKEIDAASDVAGDKEESTAPSGATSDEKDAGASLAESATSQDESEISPATDAVTGDKSETSPTTDAVTGDDSEISPAKDAVTGDESEISPVTNDDATDHKSKTSPTSAGGDKKESGVPADKSGTTDASAKSDSKTVVTKAVNEEDLLREQLYYLNTVLTEWQMITKKPFSYSTDSLSSMNDLSKTLKKIKQDLKPETAKKTEESSHSDIPPTAPSDNASLSRTTPEVVEFRWSTRLVPEKVHGFEDKILSLERLLVLRRKDTDTFKAFGIHGMAGVGKTTLCQSIFSRPRVSGYFFPRVWVCLSKQRGEDEDNKKEVVKRMLRCLGIDDKIINKVDEKQGIRGLLFALRLQLTGKRYFIVLDDAHNADEWFKMPDSDTENDNNKIYEKFSYGLPKECGGTVIVTSRVEQVVKNMVGDEENLRCIEPLTDEDTCWKIFKDTVEEDRTHFPEDLNKLKLEIVKRCDGLPLAAKLLGQIKHKELREKTGSNSSR